ncbi:hypothetical protein IWQ61_007673 [Dispira simplex]|nr:hypothetical protein IWQ61_007673 [Dispira simplex]
MFGPGWGAFGSCFCVVLGNLITIIGTYTRTFGLLVAGRLIFAFGSSTIVTTQETLLSHWFCGKGLVFTIALHIAVSKLFGWLASATVMEVVERTNFYGNSIWVGEGISLFSLLMVALYALMMWKLNRRKQCVEQLTEEVHNEGTVTSTEPPKHSVFASRDPEKAKKKKVTWRQLYYMVYFPDIYWLLPLNKFVLRAVWTTILNIATEYVEKRWHENRVMATWKSSVSMAVPVVSPVIALYIDRYGQRGHMVVVSAVLLLISVALLGWTMISPIVSLTLYSVSLTLGPVALTSAVALYLLLNMVGTGIGLIKCGLNFGVVIVDALIGRLQDNDNDSYDQVMVMMLVLSCVSLVTATAFVTGDYRMEQGIQNANLYRRKELMKARKPRKAAIQTTAAENLSFPRYRYLNGIIVVFLFVISWILYGTYLLVPQ